MKKSLKNLCLLAILSFATFSCKKDETSPNSLDSSTQQAVEERNISSDFEDDHTSINDYAAKIDPKSAGGRVEGTWLGAGQTSYSILTRTLTIDFGTTNVMCTDNKKRRGKIFIRFTEGEPRTPDHKTTTTQENYYVNDIKVEGVRVDVVKISLNNNVVNSLRDIIVTNRKLTFTDQTTLTESSNYKANGTVNLLTGSWEYTLKGQSTGIGRRGNAFSTNIATPILVKSSCATTPPISGKLEITPVVATDKITIDYGDGTCDRVATVTFRTQTVTVNF
jgi:hypothetical protein